MSDKKNWELYFVASSKKILTEISAQMLRFFTMEATAPRAG
jgi:hypothetical protein